MSGKFKIFIKISKFKNLKNKNDLKKMNFKIKLLYPNKVF